MQPTRHLPARITRCILFALVAMSAAAPASALFVPSPSVPTDRLIQNIAAYLKENPKDAQAHYTLARVHYLAFVNRLDHVRANDPGSAEKLPRIVDPRQYGKAEGKEISVHQAVDHAISAFAYFDKALKLEPNNALFHLGLASLYEQAAPLAEKIDPNPEPAGGEDDERASEKDRFFHQAIDNYLKAYRLDREAALAERSVFLPFYPVAYEAGKAYLRLTEAKDLETDDKQVAQITADLKAIDSKPKAITPIVFRVEGDAPTSLNDLIADNKTVRFDLDADGVAERRPWVNPDTAILVWDPENTGSITSGEQLFGNMTFRMLFSDGYRALDSLDDNRDGQLTGEELNGLALWHDRNSNGISDPGEVTPIADTNIRAIATTTTGTVNGLHPMHTSGLTLDDGSTRPTWDWVIPAADGQ